MISSQYLLHAITLTHSSMYNAEDRAAACTRQHLRAKDSTALHLHRISITRCMRVVTHDSAACVGSAGNRLDVFACSPAPVQVTWLGYPNTSGLSTIRYRVAAESVDPRLPVETEERSKLREVTRDGAASAAREGGAAGMQQWSEEVYYLPRTFLCYDVAAFLHCPETPPR